MRGIVKADSLGSNFSEPTPCRPCRCPATCVDEWCKDSLVDDTTTRQMAQHALYDPSENTFMTFRLVPIFAIRYQF